MNFYASSFDLKKSIVRSICAVLVGLFFCFFPNLTPQLLILILGGTILFIGAVNFLSTFTGSRKPTSTNYFNLVLSLIVGIALIAAPGFWLGFVMVMLGVVIAFCGIAQLASLIGVRQYGVKPNIAEYILGLLLLVLGVFICFKPFKSNETLMLLVGAGCIFYGLTNLLVLLHVRSQLKKAGKHVVNDVIEDIDYELKED